ncbi:hypothetical protein B4U80_14269 [Leptotrombidium deliense]|uniref:BTB domain-containing protein n=1 Tax=Leptotrombidium deliense TaxID=299467 RepID=A0A443RYK8_9ACAR|nr:hypothetical protein B4U80_14269 [Leptotrombidium deliense]
MDDLSQTILINLRQNNFLKDVTFLLEDLEIVANRSLLAASYPYFERMLFGNTNEANQKRIELRSTCKEAFQKVIEFINKGQCDLQNMRERRIINLIRLAHEYQFDELLSYLKSKINVSSYSVRFCTEFFDFATLANCNYWKNSCLINVEKWFISEVNSELFATFSRHLVGHLTARHIPSP